MMKNLKQYIQVLVFVVTLVLSGVTLLTSKELEKTKYLPPVKIYAGANFGDVVSADANGNPEPGGVGQAYEKYLANPDAYSLVQDRNGNNYLAPTGEMMDPCIDRQRVERDSQSAANGSCTSNSAPTCGSCSASCGGGTQNCSDNCSSWSQSCNTQSCCDSSAWSGWSACSKPCDGGTQSRTNGCGTVQSQDCNTFSCLITYPSLTPTPTPIGFIPSPPPFNLTPTPTPSGSYSPGWFKTESGDVHSNKDIIVSLPSLLERFATFLVTVNNLSSFAAGSANDARPELASVKNWYWYTPPYGSVTFPENSGFFSYYTHNKPPTNKLVMDDLSNSYINAQAQSGKPFKIQIDSTINMVSINETINLSSDKVLILYINGDLNVNSNIVLSDNSGIIFIVKGNLNIAPNVSEADGFYLVDKTVNSTDGSGAGKALVIRGAVFVSSGGKVFGSSRQIHDSATPSEKIIYEPKYLVEFGQSLGHEGIIWREVAP